MDVVRVAIPGTDLGHPRRILGAFATAQFFFYRSIDQDSFDFGLLRRRSDERDSGRTPNLVIDVLAVCCNQVGCRNMFAFLRT
jgi:hypothetical protein